MTKTYLKRDCPSCGTAASQPAVASDRRAEAMEIDELRPYWYGLFRDKIFFTYDRCPTCGLLYAPVFFTDAQLGELYSAMEPNMALVPTTAIDATQRGYFEVAAEGATLDGGYLEIGPDVGYLVRYAAEQGNFDKFWLFEPNRAVHAELAAATGGRAHEISTDMNDLSQIPDGSVGLAFMVHVLDHVLDPMATLKQVHAKLRPGGRLVIVTHNEGSLLRKVMGRRWPPFCLQHPELYNPQSMTQLVKRADFASVAVGRSKNYFPIAFMAQQAALGVGIKIDKVPLPKTAIGLKLGNMITVATR